MHYVLQTYTKKKTKPKEQQKRCLLCSHTRLREEAEKAMSFFLHIKDYSNKASGSLYMTRRYTSWSLPAGTLHLQPALELAGGGRTSRDQAVWKLCFSFMTFIRHGLRLFKNRCCLVLFPFSPVAWCKTSWQGRQPQRLVRDWPKMRGSKRAKPGWEQYWLEEKNRNLRCMLSSRISFIYRRAKLCGQKARNSGHTLHAGWYPGGFWGHLGT